MPGLGIVSEGGLVSQRDSVKWYESVVVFDQQYQTSVCSCPPVIDAQDAPSSEFVVAFVESTSFRDSYSLIGVAEHMASFAGGTPTGVTVICPGPPKEPWNDPTWIRYTDPEVAGKIVRDWSPQWSSLHASAGAPGHPAPA